MQVIPVDSVTKELAEKPTYLYRMACRFAWEATTIKITGSERLEKSGKLSVGGNTAVRKINNALKKINKKRTEEKLAPESVILSTVGNFSMRMILDDDALLPIINRALKYQEPKREAHPNYGRDRLTVKAKARR